MNKRFLKTGIALISYTVALVLIVVYIKEILGGINTVLNFGTSFFVGILIALFLNPPYRTLMKFFDKINCPKALARFISTIFVFALAAGIIAGIIMVVIPEVVENSKIFFSNFHNYVNSLQKTIDLLIAQFNLESFDITPVKKIIEDIGYRLKDFAISLGPKAVIYSKKVINSVTNILIGIVFSVYIINVKDTILRQTDRLSKAVFSEKVYRVVSHIGRVTVKTFDSYIAGQTIEAIILGVLFFVGMKAFGFAYPELISVIVAVTALLPMIGAYIGGFFGVFIYLLVDPVKALFFLLYFIILQQIENNLIYPKVVGRQVGLPGIWIMLAVILGSKLGGLIGALCAVPVFTIFYTLLKDLTVYKEKQKKLKELNKEVKKEELSPPPKKESFQSKLSDVEFRSLSDAIIKSINLAPVTVPQNKESNNINITPYYEDKAKTEKIPDISYKNIELDNSEVINPYIANQDNNTLQNKVQYDPIYDPILEKKYNMPNSFYDKQSEPMAQEENKKRTRNIGFFSNKLKNSSKK